MGVGIFKVSEAVKNQCPYATIPPPPNPNPTRFEIIKIESINKFVIVQINYPDCTSFEGKKILVYDHIEVNKILTAKFLDPHFSNDLEQISPIARFEPIERGWNMGVAMMKFYDCFGVQSYD